MKRIIIFGCSLCGERAYQHYSQTDTEIVAFSDNNPAKHHQSFFGVPIIPPEDIARHEYDMIIIASTFHPDIKAGLILEQGIPAEKIDIVATNIAKGNLELGEGERKVVALDILIYITHALNNAGINYHVDHGTLLGIFRDDDLLPWDNDIDMGIQAEDLDRTLAVVQLALADYNRTHQPINKWLAFTVEGVLNFDKGSREVTRIIKIKNGVENDTHPLFMSADIIVKYPDQGKSYWLAGRVSLQCPTVLIRETVFHDFRGHTLRIPADASAYLELLYGDWKTPKKEWNHTLYDNISC